MAFFNIWKKSLHEAACSAHFAPLQGASSQGELILTPPADGQRKTIANITEERKLKEETINFPLLESGQTSVGFHEG